MRHGKARGLGRCIPRPETAGAAWQLLRPHRLSENCLLPGLLLAVCLFTIGCASGPVGQRVTALKRTHPLGVTAGPDSVQLEIALLECPLGDAYINKALWTGTDEQVIAPEALASLVENGFRVGQIGGLVPDELLALLTSKRSNVNPRQRVVLLNQPADLNLGSTAAQCSFHLVQGAHSEDIHFDQAQCKLDVIPSLTAEGKIRLHFTPRVDHGERVPHFHPAADGSGFIMEVERSRQTYPSLAWDVTLAPNEYVLVGARFEQPGTLGFAGFVEADGTNNVQRLLVIRTSRPGAPSVGPGGEAEMTAPGAGQSPPLAFQAQMRWTARAAGGS